MAADDAADEIAQWHAIWQQLTATGEPFEVVTPDGDGPRYFANAPVDLVNAVQVGRQFGERPFLLWQEQRLSYAEFYARVDQLTARLVRQMGIHPGDRVAIAMRNRPEWMLAFVALIQAGAIPVPLNSWGQRDELLHALGESEPGWLVCDAPRLAQVEDCLPGLGVRALVVDADGPLPAAWQAWEALFQGQIKPVAPVTVHPQDPALILYTSGTTSRPKGVVSSHAAICQALYAFEFQGVFAAMTSPERIRPLIESGVQPGVLLAVPLFHVSGLYAHFLNALRTGKRLVMMYKWDAGQALELIERERCTQFNGAPVMMQQLLAHPRFSSEATADLIGLGLGGSATGTHLLQQLLSNKPRAMFGVGYGMTESNAIGTTLAGEQFIFRPEAVGWPLPVVDIRIGDDWRTPLPPGQQGPIWLRSSTLMQGYWKHPQESAKSLRDGWLYSGDIGFVDDLGFLHVTDRIKDLVIRGGENISAQEVEDCALMHPAVIEAAVIARPDPEFGECVALAATCQPGAHVQADDLRRFMAERLAHYKLPEQIVFCDDGLPRNSSGKVFKRALHALFEPSA